MYNTSPGRRGKKANAGQSGKLLHVDVQRGGRVFIAREEKRKGSFPRSFSIFRSVSVEPREEPPKKKGKSGNNNT